VREGSVLALYDSESGSRQNLRHLAGEVPGPFLHAIRQFIPGSHGWVRAPAFVASRSVFPTSQTLPCHPALVLGLRQILYFGFGKLKVCDILSRCRCLEAQSVGPQCGHDYVTAR
jgi:hypothetical protein